MNMLSVTSLEIENQIILLLQKLRNCNSDVNGIQALEQNSKIYILFKKF